MQVKKFDKRKKLTTRELVQQGWKPYRQLVSYIKPYRKRFLIGFISGIIFGATNGLLPADIRFVMSVIFPASSSKLPAWVQHMNDHIAHRTGSHTAVVIAACLSVPMVMAIRCIFNFLENYLMAWVSLRVLKDIQRKLFTHIMRQPMEFFNRNRSGQLIAHISNDARMAQQALSSLSSDLIAQPMAIMSGVAFLFWTDWKFCLVTLVLFPVCLVPVMVFGKKVRDSGREEERKAGMMMVILQEAFAGVRVIKSFARERYEAERFDETSDAQFAGAIRVRKSMEIVGPMVEIVGAFGVMLTLFYVYFAHLPLDKFTSLNGGILLLYPSIKSLSKVNLLLQKCLGATSSIFDLLDIKPSIQDKPDAIVLKNVRGDLRFENVTFGYIKSRPPAVKNFALHVEPGKTYALVGASGAGKSTLYSLILRFYEPETGGIHIDGHDLREVTQQSLREHIAVVTQDTFLFHETIADNIRYGRFDATDEEIIFAAQQAYAHEFILAQPKGYETVVGDKGCMLSGGQQQRIAIARALLKNAPILLLDEATSALDSESEKQIQRALDTLSKGRTVIAIAHRLSTILNANQIVVMDRGRIVEIGPHQQLFEKNGLYRRLYDLQFNRQQEVETQSLAVA